MSQDDDPAFLRVELESMLREPVPELYTVTPEDLLDIFISGGGTVGRLMCEALGIDDPDRIDAILHLALAAISANRDESIQAVHTILATVQATRLGLIEAGEQVAARTGGAEDDLPTAENPTTFCPVCGRERGHKMSCHPQDRISAARRILDALEE